MRARHPRQGFTLIEMLVVLIVALALTAMLVMASLRNTDKNLVPNGSSLLQGMLAQARVRALAEKRPVGVRLLVAAQNPPGVPSGVTNRMYVATQLQYIHNPGDLADGWVTSDANIAVAGDQQIHPDTGALLTPSDALFGRLIYGPPAPVGATFPYTGFSFGEDPGTTAIGGGAVMPGDGIEFHGGGQAMRVEFAPAVLSALGVTRSVYHPSQATGLATAGVFPRTVLVLDRPLDHSIQPPTSVLPRSNYRVMRQPRPLPGEAPVALPNDVFIIGEDIDPSGYFFDPPTNLYKRRSSPTFTGDVDILFAPSGQVMGAAAEGIFLWVSDSASAQTTPADTNWALVAVFTRTGAVGVYPVNQQPSANPYVFAQVGRGAGM